MIEQQPEVVQKMVDASIRGWRTYLETHEATNQYIHQLNPEMGLDILAYGADQMDQLCVSESTPVEDFGRMTEHRWQELADLLDEVGTIPSAADVGAAFTTEFLKRTERAE